MSNEVRRVYKARIEEAERHALACEKLFSIASAAQESANTMRTAALAQWKQATANVSKLRELLQETPHGPQAGPTQSRPQNRP